MNASEKDPRTFAIIGVAMEVHGGFVFGDTKPLVAPPVESV
jgi:hypothetical protein